jgi:polyisoprenoid-binding protein YceI
VQLAKMSKNSRRNIKTAAAGLVEAMVLLGEFACSHNLLGEQMKTFAAFAVAVVLTQNAVAQHLNLAVDPDASEVKMTLKTNHEVVNGTFQVQSGLIDLDRSDAKISGSVVLAAGSGKTGNDSRDKRMENDVLRVNQYTTVSFAPKTYTGTIAASGDSSVQVSGVLTLLGTLHDMTIPVHVHMDGSNATAKAQFVIPYA